MERIRLERRKSPSRAVVPPSRQALFGPPLLLEGEDAAAYDELLASVCAAVKPIDIIDEMFIADAVFLEWEVLRWRRLKLALMRSVKLEMLEQFLGPALDADMYSEALTKRLAEFLQDQLPEDKDAQTLAEEYVQNEPDAVEKVNGELLVTPMDMNEIIADAQTDQAQLLVQQYVQGEPEAVALIRVLLTRANTDIDALTAEALVEKLDEIERFDRLTANAEVRRNISLREIDRRRLSLGQNMRRSFEAIEDAEFEEVETAAKGDKAA